MATIRKRGKRWYCELRLQGQRQGRSFATKAEAATWALQREAEMRGDRLPDATLAEVIRRYRDEVAPTHRGSVYDIRRCNAMLREPFVDRPIASITATDIADMRDRRLKAVKPASVAREMTVWRCVFEQARREWGLLRTNPMADVRSPGGHESRERRVPDDELERMRLALGWPADETPRTAMQQIAVAMFVAIETAMRAGELLSLSWDQVDLDARFARLSRTKNGDQRDVPLSRRAVELLKLLPSHKTGGTAAVFDVAESTRDQLWRRARDRADLADLRFHDLRHEATTRLARRLDVLDLSRMTGHRDLRMLRRYYNPTATEIAARLDGD